MDYGRWPDYGRIMKCTNHCLGCRTERTRATAVGLWHYRQEVTPEQLMWRHYNFRYHHNFLFRGIFQDAADNVRMEGANEASLAHPQMKR